MAALHKSDSLRLLQGGEALFPALVEAFDSAQRWIQLETYIFDFHGAGAEVAEALMRAAQRGVSVQVLVDGVGTEVVPDEWLDKLRGSGVELQIYSPLGSGLLGLLVPERWRRLHRKLCVVDLSTLFCGGINILDDFYDPNHGELSAPRFDFAVAATGPLATEAADAMALLWWRVQAGYSARQRHLSAAWESFKAAGYGGRTGAEPRPLSAGRGTATAGLAPGPKAALVLRDNLLNRRAIERAYRKAIGRARDEIIIANAYFFPGRGFRQALVRAAGRGVRVTLLLQGRVEYILLHYASRALYGMLLEAGVEIREYHKSFLHAKVAVIDGHWATVGSSNIDPFSLFLAREANVVVEDRDFAAQLRLSLHQAMEEGALLVPRERWFRQPLWKRLPIWVGYGLVRFLTGIVGYAGKI